MVMLELGRMIGRKMGRRSRCCRVGAPVDRQAEQDPSGQLVSDLRPEPAAYARRHAGDRGPARRQVPVAGLLAARRVPPVGLREGPRVLDPSALRASRSVVPGVRQGRHFVAPRARAGRGPGGALVTRRRADTSDSVVWRCAAGHRWSSNAHRVARGAWCPYCAGHRRTIEDMQALAAAHDGRCVSKRYVDQDTKLRWECERGHRGWTRPANVRRGAWCPDCAWDEHAARMRSEAKDWRQGASGPTGG